MKGNKEVRISRPKGSDEELEALDSDERLVEDRLRGRAPAQQPSAEVVQTRENLKNYKTVGQFLKEKGPEEYWKKVAKYF